MPAREIEDHVRIELHPDTHLLLGYFDPFVCEEYVLKIMVMLRTPSIPGSGYRQAMASDFGVNPLVNSQSHHYVVDLATQHPLIASDRMEYLLRSHLKSAFERTCVSVCS